MNRALRNTKFFCYQADWLSSFHYIIPYPDSPLFDVIMHPVRLPILFLPRCHVRHCPVPTWSYNPSASLIDKYAGSHVLFTTVLLSIFLKKMNGPLAPQIITLTLLLLFY